MKRILSLVLALVLLLALGTGLYVNDYYHAQKDALEIYDSAQHSGSRILFRPEEATDTGLIFYPGGKVEPSAYAPLLQKLSENGILCVLQKMPGNLAVLNPNAAADIFDAYPEIAHWYIAGHSLGGSMGARFAGKHPDCLEGVILLAAYSANDLSSTRVLSIYGTEDGVLNREKYEKNRKNLPEDATEIILDGGNHAFFGSYGIQKGDGQATVSQEWQQAQTVQAITQFIRGTTNAQLALIDASRDTWKALDETEAWCYAVTDLDGNGRLEILSSETHGSGHFTTFRAWEVGEDFVSLIPIAEPGDYGSIVVMGASTYEETTLVKDAVDRFTDPQTDISYYVQEDIVKDGAAHYYETKSAVFLSGGTMDRVILGYLQTDYSADDYGTVTYHAPDDSPISEEAYMNPPRLSGMTRSAAQIGWLTYFRSNDLTRDALASSWEAFQG